MHHIRFLVVAVVIILIVSAVLWFYLRGDKEVEGILDANGQVRGTEITISTKIPGRLVSLQINEGQPIKKEI